MDTIVARGRIAPSPTGRMHLGNAFAFLMAFCSVKSKGGALVLRIEDIDPDRSRLEFEQGILEDLAWLGISYDEGPLLHGDVAPYRQSERKKLYKSAIQVLKKEGLIYPCFCTRKELKMLASAPHNEDGSVQYPGTCRHLFDSEQKRLIASGKKACLRLNVEKSLALLTPSTKKQTCTYVSSSQEGSNPSVLHSSGQITTETNLFSTKVCGALGKDTNTLGANSFGVGKIKTLVLGVEELGEENLEAESFHKAACCTAFPNANTFGIDSCSEKKTLFRENTDSSFPLSSLLAPEIHSTNGSQCLEQRGHANNDVILDELSFSEVSSICNDDFALMRSDGVFAYQLAVVVDDIAMNITEVVRGNDLEKSTPRQKLLYYLLGASPPSFYHFPLLCDHNGDRLAKRHDSLTLASLREQGIKPEVIIGYLGFLSGLIDTKRPMLPMELVTHWNKDNIRQEAIVLPQDIVKELCS